jgi:hypothetical protein
MIDSYGQLTVLANFYSVESNLVAKDDNTAFFIGTLNSSDSRALWSVSTSGIVRLVTECWVFSSGGYMRSLAISPNGDRFWYFAGFYYTNYPNDYYYFECDVTNNATYELYKYSSSGVPDTTQYHRQNSTTSVLLANFGGSHVYYYGILNSSYDDMGLAYYCDLDLSAARFCVHQNVIYYIDYWSNSLAAARLTSQPSAVANCSTLFTGVELNASHEIAYRDGFIYYWDSVAEAFSKFDLANNRSYQVYASSGSFSLISLAVWDGGAFLAGGAFSAVVSSWVMLFLMIAHALLR